MYDDPFRRVMTSLYILLISLISITFEDRLTESNRHNRNLDLPSRHLPSIAFQAQTSFWLVSDRYNTAKRGHVQTTKEPFLFLFRHSPDDNSSIFKQEYIRNPFLIMFIIIRFLPIASITRLSTPSSWSLAESSLSPGNRRFVCVEIQ